MNGDTDERGWSIGMILPSDRPGSFTLFAREVPARFDVAALARAIRDVGATALTLAPPKRYEAGAPTSDRADVSVSWHGLAATAEVRMFPIERGLVLRRSALDAARAMGGQGMDSLVERARRVIQILPAADLDPDVAARIGWTLAFAFAGTDLAAIHPPSELRVVGPRTAREEALRRGRSP